ncbi:HutD family protein [Archangium primigenium]|uniref:HutD/Ves family protein n=1 Tax=[Archangium] primigenium TaxID=2792470 RepID=UPI001958DB85|nr:HutD family protein [Archangium primigenium]MBM7113133.1 HutD family protein [Archangium primigenium]
MRRRGVEDYQDMPWKNGGGVTRELLRWPHPRHPQDFRVRLSIATVATSGPFSLFAGVDRTLVVLEGTGLGLTLADGAGEVALRPTSPPFAFPGDVACDCRLLGGPVRDFNVMVDRSLGSAVVERVLLAAGERRDLGPEAGTLWLYGLSGQARVGDDLLAAEDLLEWDAPGVLRLQGVSEAHVLVIRLSSPA